MQKPIELSIPRAVAALTLFTIAIGYWVLL